MALNAIQEEVVVSLETQGDTGSASRVKITANRNGAALTEPFSVRARVCNDGTFVDSTNATIALVSGFGTQITEHTATKDYTWQSVETKSTGVLTLTGVATDGETVTLGSKTYEFDNDESYTAGNIQVDISARATKAQGTLTMVTQPTALDALEIDGKGYVWVADGTADTPGEISVGADLAAAQVNFVAAVNGTDGFNTAHPTVTAAAFAANASVLTANAYGVVGNSITTTESFTAVGNVFDAGTLGTTTAGADCSAADAITDLVAAVTADSTAEVTAADGAGDTVDVTAVVAGYAGDAIATTTTMANASFGAATLSGAAIPSEIFIDLTDASAETVTVRCGQADFDSVNAEYRSAVLDVTHAAP